VVAASLDGLGLEPRGAAVLPAHGAKRALHPAPTLGTMPAMKKPRQKTARSPQLQAQDLASVRGGDNGVIHGNATVGGGIGAHDNGVITSSN
jgi:hypothetical protein